MKLKRYNRLCVHRSLFDMEAVSWLFESLKKSEETALIIT